MIRKLLFLLSAWALLAVPLRQSRAQVNARTAVPAEPAARMAEAAQRKAQLEQRSAELLRQWQQGSRSPALRADIQASLYALFDLGVEQKMAEAADLRAQLRTLEADPGLSTETGKIQTLKAALVQVEAALQQRRDNRDLIVQRRLRDLLGE
ncbi:MAG: hypothetical protein NW241_22550 [Bacteroidia bacterium]|nr:hypothetical protein [Bacteroidia bacterium]